MRSWLQRLRERVLAIEGPALLATIVAVALVACALIVASLVDTLDTTAAERERSAVDSSIAVALAASAESAYSMARWDEAVAHVYGRFDRQWALSSISGTSITYIVDDHGRTLFAERSDGTVDPDLASVARPALVALLHRLPHTRAEAGRMTQGVGLLGSYRGRPAMFTAMAISPLRGAYQIPDDHLRHLIYVGTIDAALLGQWQRNYRLPPMRLSRTPGMSQAVAVTDAGGTPMTYITWAASRPGHRALIRIAPLIVAAVSILMAAAGTLMFLLRRQSASLRAASAEHQLLAEDAERARAIAEAAQRDAERARDAAQQSRRQAEAAAAQAEQERTRHAADLREAARTTAQSVRTALSASVDELGRMADRLDSSADASVTATTNQSREAAEAERRTASAVVSLEHILHATAGLSATVSMICGESERTRDAVALASRRSALVASANAELLATLADVRVAIDTIATIAAQTNMLALNAAIEAARYDSRNSGFGVVAREVKDLAHATAQSAAAISRHVDDIGRAVQGSVDLSAGIDSELHKILGFATNAATAAQGQDGVSSNIAQSVAAAREEARAIDGAAAGIAAAIASLARNTAETRDVSSQVRARVADLDRALQRELARLLAA